MHAQVGHNEPNQPTNVHTIDNKPYISELRSASSAGDGENGGDLYLGIAET